MMSILLRFALPFVFLALSPTFGNGELLTSDYGPVAETLLERMHADTVPCDDVLDVPETCFAVAATGLSLIAETLGEVVDQFAVAGLSASAWTSGNGVHSVRLHFVTNGPEALEVFLSEESPSHVRGVLRLIRH